jgi:hypothetical protein
MPQSPADFARPQDDARRRWYLRWLQEIDRGQRTSTPPSGGLFGDLHPSKVDPGFSPVTSFQDVDPGFGRSLDQSGADIDPGFSVPGGSRRSLPPTIPMRGPGVSLSHSLGASSASKQSAPNPPAPVRPKHPGMRLDEAFRTLLTGPPPLEPANRQSSGQAARPNPEQTNVFRRGPDGKLHPIPGWHTTGPDDFGAWSHNIDWEGVGADLTDVSSAALDTMTASGLLESLGLRSVLEGARKGLIHRHHVDPKVIGGRLEQETVDLIRSFHTKFHQRLNTALQQAGLHPTSGGRTGSADVWRDLFRDKPHARDRAIEILRRETQKFDTEHGTSILPYLEKELRIVRPKAPPRRK